MMVHTDHYWIVNGSATQVFSSKTGTFVLVSNQAYEAWLAAGGAPSRVATTADVMSSIWRVSADFPGLADLCKAALGNPACRRRFRAAELLLELTAADAILLRTAVAGPSGVFWLQWNRFVVYPWPIHVQSTFGVNLFSSLVTILGQPRVTAIRTALGLLNGP